jgi:hypothetical protein
MLKVFCNYIYIYIYTHTYVLLVNMFWGLLMIPPHDMKHDPPPKKEIQL